MFRALALAALVGAAAAQQSQQVWTIGGAGFSGTVYDLQVYDYAISPQCLTNLLANEPCASQNVFWNVVTLPGVGAQNLTLVEQQVINAAASAGAPGAAVDGVVVVSSSGDVSINVTSSTQLDLNALIAQLNNLSVGYSAVGGRAAPLPPPAAPVYQLTLPGVTDIAAVNLTAVGASLATLYPDVTIVSATTSSASGLVIAFSTQDSTLAAAAASGGASGSGGGSSGGGGGGSGGSGGGGGGGGGAFAAAASALWAALNQNGAFVASFPATGAPAALALVSTGAAPATTYVALSVGPGAAWWLATANWAAAPGVQAAGVLDAATVQLQLPGGVAVGAVLAALNASTLPYTVSAVAAPFAAAPTVLVTVTPAAGVGGVKLVVLAAAASPGSSLLYWRAAAGSLVVALDGGGAPPLGAADAVRAGASLPPGATATVEWVVPATPFATDSFVLGLVLASPLGAFACVLGAIAWMSVGASGRRRARRAQKLAAGDAGGALNQFSGTLSLSPPPPTPSRAPRAREQPAEPPARTAARARRVVGLRL